MVKWTGINLSLIPSDGNLRRPAMIYTYFLRRPAVSSMEYQADHVRLTRMKKQSGFEH